MASRGVNKVTLIGYLGADPELRTLPNGSVTSARLATTSTWKDKQSGEQREATEWHSLTLWNKGGEIFAQYAKKGAQVYVEGSLKTEKFQDKQTGADRYVTKIVVDDFRFLGGKRDGGAPAASSEGGEQGSQDAGSSDAPASSEQDFDDDIPF